MNYIKFFLFFSLPLSVGATCQDAYKAYKRSTLVSPVTASFISSTHVAEGAISTFGNLTSGAARVDVGLSTAGTANGLAFSYEGHFYLELMSSNLRHYRGRSKVLTILNQAELGIGEELENLLDDLNDSMEENEVDFYDLVDRINEANKKKVFCPKNKELYTLKNLRNYLFAIL